MTNNILVDLYGTFVALRADSKGVSPEVIKEIILSLFDKSVSPNENIVRQTLRRFQLHLTSSFSFAKADNTYIYIKKYENKQIIDITKMLLYTTYMLMEEKKYSQLFDYLDAVHFFPIIIISQKIRFPKMLIRKLLKPYCYKWHCPLDEYKELHTQILT